MELNFTKNIAKEDIPNIKVAFTSNENAVGSNDAQWFEGESYNIEIVPRDKMTYKISLKLEKLQQLEETSHCSSDNDYYRCLAKRYIYANKGAKIQCTVVTKSLGTIFILCNETTSIFRVTNRFTKALKMGCLINRLIIFIGLLKR